MERLFKISFLSVTISVLSACSLINQFKGINTSYRPLTQQEKEAQQTELNARLIAQQAFNASTVLVYETPNIFWYGTAYARIEQSPNGNSQTFPDFRNLKKEEPNSLKQATVFTVDESLSSTDFSYQHNYVLAVIHAPTLHQKANAIQLVFEDNSKSEPLPLNGQKALIHPYNPEEGDCCKQVDFLSADGQILHSRADDKQIFPK